MDIPCWPLDEAFPAYVCDTSRQPYQHFLRAGPEPVYYYAAECSQIEHLGSYPHEHQEGEL